MSNFAKRMYDLEIRPPVVTWDDIARDLDESDLDKNYPARLAGFSAPPPAGVWDRISETLNEGAIADETPVRSIAPSAFTKFTRYAVAAVIAGGLIFGGIQLFNTSESPTAVADHTPTPSPAPRLDAPPVPTNDLPLPNELERQRSAEALAEAARANEGRSSVGGAGYNSESTDAYQLAAVRNAGEMASDGALNPLYAYEDHLPNMIDKYIMLRTADGSFIRMSKKWSEMLCCVSGEEQDADCTDQLKKWQQKLAESPIAPGPDNFMDIINLVNSLNDDTQL